MMPIHYSNPLFHPLFFVHPFVHYRKGPIKPHPARGVPMRVLFEVFPRSETLEASNTGRARHSTVTVGDVIWYLDGNALHVGILKCICSVDGADIAMLECGCLREPITAAVAWYGVTRTGELVMLPWADVLLSSVYSHGADAMLVHLPYVLR